VYKKVTRLRDSQNETGFDFVELIRLDAPRDLVVARKN
jgi:hypothetical protein